MESFACQEVAPSQVEGPALAATRLRQLAVGFRFDRSQERPRLPGPRPAIAVPAHSRIVYHAGAVRVR
jgi:hypothetical protein